MENGRRSDCWSCQNMEERKGMSLLRVVLLLAVVCLVTNAADGVGNFASPSRLINPSKMAVPFGKANLVVIGEDQKKTVQTLLENLGLWETINWKKLLYCPRLYCETELIEFKTEENVFKVLRGLTTNRKENDGCFCGPLLRILNEEKRVQNRTHDQTQKTSPAHQKKDVVIVVVFSFDQGNLKMKEKCADIVKRSGLHLVIVAADKAKPTTWLNSWGATNVRVHQAITGSQVPRSPSEWETLHNERLMLSSCLREFFSNDMVTIPKATCYAKIPDLSNCTDTPRKICTCFKPIDNKTTDCPETNYCRTCFVKDAKTGTQENWNLSTSSVTSLPFKQEDDSEDGGETDAEAFLPLWAIGVIAASVIFFLATAAIGLFYIWQGMDSTTTSQSKKSYTAPARARAPAPRPNFKSVSTETASSEDPSIPLGPSLKSADYGIFTESHSATNFSHPASRIRTATPKKGLSPSSESDKTSVDVPPLPGSVVRKTSEPTILKRQPSETIIAKNVKVHTDPFPVSHTASSPTSVAKKRKKSDEKLKRPEEKSVTHGDGLSEDSGDSESETSES